jgi:hypothetical protein
LRQALIWQACEQTWRSLRPTLRVNQRPQLGAGHREQAIMPAAERGQRNDDVRPLRAATATHDLGDLEDIADRCYVLDAGELVAERSPFDILHGAELLRRTNLVHAHRHRHGNGEMHSHPHLHGHDAIE